MVTDVVMPGMHGDEVATQVRRCFPDIKVIFMSGYIENGEALLHAGAQVLLKPFSALDLLSRVKKTILGC
jgi:CheY-like chemotaxis protein